MSAGATDVRLLSLAPVEAPFLLEQGDVARRARNLLGPKIDDFDRLAKLFGRTGIVTRQAVRPPEWYEVARSWPERTEAYLESATSLFVRAAEAALSRAEVPPDAVDAVVTVSSTGIATPSLEARALERLGLRSDVQRVPVFGLGCAGGVTGLSLAARLARSAPGRCVLLVVVEVCTLAFRWDRGSKADVVATALFGDGAAGAVLRAEGGASSAPSLGAAFEHTWPNTLDVMGWSIDPLGFGVIFDRAIPPFVGTEYARAVARFLDSACLERSEITRFVCHPGGAKVVSALEGALDVPQGTLDAEREVLRDHGNMSAPTVLFVLDRMLRNGFCGTAVLCALGPGFTASFLSLFVPERA